MILKTNKISLKFAFVMVVLSLIATGVTGLVAFNRTSEDLQQAAESKLLALLESREKALENYLQSLRQDMRVSSEAIIARKGLIEFTSAWQSLGPEATTILQRLYIHDNPHQTGRKEDLDRADDNSEYSTVHGRYHPVFRKILRQWGYYDIFLISPNGDLVYTVFKEPDFATNLVTGPWKDTDLGKAFRIVRDNPTAGFQTFLDFQPYAPSQGKPASFIASPVHDETGVLIGIIAFQMPIGRINNIMHVSIGMGESGETYIVGDDLLMRSDSRFSETSTILKTRVDTETVHKALAGESGVAVTLDYRGILVLSAFTPLHFMGSNWAIMAEIDRAEVLQPLYQTGWYLLWSSILIGLLAISVGIFFSIRLVKPIQSITTVLRRLADDELDVEVPSFNRKDEIGSLVDAAHVFKNNAVKMRKLQKNSIILLKNFAVTTNEATNAEEVLQLALNAICTYTGWPVGHAYISTDDGSSLLNPSTIWFLEHPKQFETFRQVTEATQFRSGEGLPGRVLLSKKPVWIVDVTKDPNFPRAKHAKDIGVRAGFAFPVFVGQNVFAVLEFYSVESAEPDPLVQDVIEILSTQLGRVIERMRAEKMVVEARDAAEQASRAKSNFISNVSHELRTPMNAIIGMTHLALRGDSTNKQHEYLNKIQSSSRSLHNLIQGMLDFSDIDTGTLTFTNIEFELKQIVENLLAVVRATATKKGLNIKVLYDEDLPALLRGDPDRLSQVLMYLVDNAIKFTEAGEITLHLKKIRNYQDKVLLEFSISDTGIGFKPSDTDKLFQAFTQGDASSTRSVGGTGLSLALCKELVRMMGGEIKAQSEPGRGSTFTFTAEFVQLTGQVITDSTNENSLNINQNNNVRSIERSSTDNAEYTAPLNKGINEVEGDISIDSSKLEPILIELDHLLMEGDTEASGQLSLIEGYLCSAGLQVQVEALKDQIDDFDFEDARETLSEIAEPLSVSLTGSG